MRVHHRSHRDVYSFVAIRDELRDMRDELRQLRADFREMREATRAAYERPACSWCGRHRSPDDVVERHGLRICSSCATLLAQIFAALRDETDAAARRRRHRGAPEPPQDCEGSSSPEAQEVSGSAAEPGDPEISYSDPVLVASNSGWNRLANGDDGDLPPTA